jgi:LysM repeat protein
VPQFMRIFFIGCLGFALLAVARGEDKPVYPLPRAAFPEPGIYIVQPGDSAPAIAKNLCLTLGRLSTLNPGVNWSDLKPGQRLFYVSATPTEIDKAHDVDFDNFRFATGVFDTQFIDIPLDAPLASGGVLVEGYKGGKAINIEGPATVSSDPPEDAKAFKICVCVTPARPPDIDRSKRIRGDYPRMPGTGSMRLGISFRVISKSGSANGSGSAAEVSNADFDFYDLLGMQCLNGPFKIIDSHHSIHATPVVVYLPRKFDFKTLKGDLDALSLPNGTVVVYAIIKKAP